MTLQLSTTVSDDIIRDFANEFHEAYELCEIKLVELENNPTNQNLVNLLFRSVHSIKGNLSFVGLQPMLPLLQSIEDLLSKVRDGSLAFSAGLSDVILLSMDCAKSVVDEITGQNTSEVTTVLIDTICHNIASIINAAPGKLNTAINNTINALAPETVIPAAETSPVPAIVKPPTDEKNLIKILSRHNIIIDEDLNLMIGLIKPLEQRSPYWHGKSARLLLFALGLNKLSDNRVDPKQLAAATLMHDFGMSFLPISLLHKTSSYTQKEKKQIHQHPRTAHELLYKLQNWEPAAEIVYQHHEHMNGAGYPHGLFETEICDGAKILSIVDTFDAIMHDRAHIEKVKRPFIRAILEINRFSGTQFSSEWVELFNQFAQKLHQSNAHAF